MSGETWVHGSAFGEEEEEGEGANISDSRETRLFETLVQVEGRSLAPPRDPCSCFRKIGQVYFKFSRISFRLRKCTMLNPGVLSE